MIPDLDNEGNLRRCAYVTTVRHIKWSRAKVPEGVRPEFEYATREGVCGYPPSHHNKANEFGPDGGENHAFVEEGS